MPDAVSLYDQLTVGQAPPIAPDPVTIVIFGGGGDLAHRKLLPALYNLAVDGLLPPRIAIVGVGRKPMDDAAYRAFAREGVDKFSRRPIDNAIWSTFAESIFFARATIDDTSSYPAFRSRIEGIEKTRALPGNRVFYLAVPP